MRDDDRIRIRSLQLSLPLDGGACDVVGTLGRNENGFVFEYAAELLRSDLPLLPDLPRPDRAYHSRRLWPFFAVRLPPLDRPDVWAELERREIDTDDTLQLLGSLGRNVISSPYQLTAAAA